MADIEDSNIYGTKYFMEWQSIDLDSYRLNFDYKGLIGEEPIQLKGYADIERPGVDDVLECIRGTSANITIHANNELNINELYFENERTVRIVFLRNDEIIFRGYIKPDGVGQSFTEANYDIQLDAIDNLGTLKDLAFLNREGSQFSGKITELEAVEAALYRTGLKLPVNICIQKRHVEAPQDKCPLAYTKVNTEQYYKEDGTTLMDCEKVLKSILEPYGAIVMQYEGEWFIFSPLDYINTSRVFDKYDNGSYLGAYAYGNIPTIYSHVVNPNGFFHINKNQWISMEGSLGALRVEYNYGNASGVMRNPTFQKTVNGVDGWIVEEGVGFVSNGIYAYQENMLVTRLDQSIAISEGDALDLNIKFRLDDYMPYFDFQLKVGDYYLSGNEWVQDPLARTRVDHYKATWEFPSQDWGSAVFVRKGAGDGEITISAPPAPVTGSIGISVLTGSFFIPDDPDANDDAYYQVGSLTLKYFSAVIGKNQKITGETHTIKKKRNSSIVKNNIKVYNGDNQSDAYLGTLYDLNDNPTAVWNRKYTNEYKELLHLMVEDYAVLNAKPAQVFKGDVKGFFPYLCRYKIDGVEGTFMPVSYLFRTKENVTELEGKQVFQDFNIEYEYEKNIELKESVKPTLD